MLTHATHTYAISSPAQSAQPESLPSPNLLADMAPVYSPTQRATCPYKSQPQQAHQWPATWFEVQKFINFHQTLHPKFPKTLEIYEPCFSCIFPAQAQRLTPTTGARGVKTSGAGRAARLGLPAPPPPCWSGGAGGEGEWEASGACASEAGAQCSSAHALCRMHTCNFGLRRSWHIMGM